MCVVCGSAQSDILFTVYSYPVHECQTCKLQYLWPQPTDEDLTRIYSENYFFGKDVGELEQSRLKRATANLYLDQIEKRVGNPVGKKLLEIGCGNGDFLHEASKRGFEVSGLEYSRSAAEEANAKLSAHSVIVGSADTIDLPLGYYDVVVGCDVIEHVRDPRKFSERIYNSLKPKGLFYCVTPSRASLSAKLMGERWVEYKEEHLFYFDPKNIARLFQQAGFRLAETQSNYKILSPSYIVAHFKRFPKPGWTPFVVTAAKFLPSFILNAKIRIVASGVTVMARK